MGILKLLKRLPLDLGQAELKHTTEGKQIARAAIPRTGGTALDVGCRDGFFTEILKRSGYSVTSIDIEPKYPGASVVDVDKRLPYKAESFNLVWCSEVIEHLKNPRFSIDEFRRVLKPGGRLIITTPNSGCWFYRLFSMFGFPPARMQNPDHKHFFFETDIRALFPLAQIYGYFPYAILKFRIRKGVGLLSPTFVVIEDKVW